MLLDVAVSNLLSEVSRGFLSSYKELRGLELKPGHFPFFHVVLNSLFTIQSFRFIYIYVTSRDEL